MKKFGSLKYYSYLSSMKESKYKGYFVNEQGEVFSNHSGSPRKMKPTKLKSGYFVMGLKTASPKTQYLHRVVAETLVPNPHNKEQVNHIDGDKSNNHPSNLEWVTKGENLKHAKEAGLYRKGEDHQMARLSDKDIETIVYLYRDLGWKQHEIAKEFKTTQPYISQIINKKRRYWR